MNTREDGSVLTLVSILIAFACGWVIGPLVTRLIVWVTR